MNSQVKLIVLSILFGGALVLLDIVVFPRHSFPVQYREIPYRIEAPPLRAIAVRAITALCFLGLGLYAARLLSKQKRIERELRESTGKLRELAAYLQNIREKERTQIAREVHDQLGQALTVLKMDLSGLRKRIPQTERSLIDKTDSMLACVDDTIETVRDVCRQLRPGVLDDFGLAAAVEWEAHEFQKRNNIQVDMEIDPNVEGSDELTTAIFRIFQETLTNVARHADARRVALGLRRRNGSVVLEVQDDGNGIAQEKLDRTRSLGLLGVRERAHSFGGTVSIEGNPGKGTRVTAVFPVNGTQTQHQPVAGSL